MQKTYTCEEIVDGMNKGNIKEVCFSVADYGHYGNCIAKSLPENLPDTAEVVLLLTPDGSEKITFCGRLNPDEKVFAIKGKGKYSFKQIWNRIVITSVKFAE